MIKIVNLYPSLMGTYGDVGNVLCLSYRLKMRGIEHIVETVNVDNKIPTDGNLYILGGGEDDGQNIACQLLGKNNILKKIFNDGAFGFVVCAGMQIIGDTYEVDGAQKDGLGILNFTTKRLQNRAVGELWGYNNNIGELSGFENHGGGTILSKDIKPLCELKVGVGNGFSSTTDGFITENIIGTYMHGPALVRNNNLCDYVIEKIIGKKLQKIDDDYSDEIKNERKHFLKM